MLTVRKVLRVGKVTIRTGVTRSKGSTNEVICKGKDKVSLLTVTDSISLARFTYST